MSRTFTASIAVRGYELDGFGHLNHAVFLNYFEHARFQAFAAAGVPLEKVMARGEGIHVVRVEVDYLREAKLGDEYLVDSRVESSRRSSMTLHQVMYLAGERERPHAEARVVGVWVGTDGNPTRIPDVVREALGFA